MSWGSADLVPTSRPLRSERALGSVVPFALSSSQTQNHTSTRGSLNQGVMSGWEASKRPPQIGPQTTCDLILFTCPSEVRAQSQLNSPERGSKILPPPFLIGGNDASL